VPETQASNKGQAGLIVRGRFFIDEQSKQVSIELEVTNKSAQNITEFDLKFNKNSFKLSITGAVNKLQVPQGQVGSVTLPCVFNSASASSEAPSCPFNVQVAMKTSLGVFIYKVPCMISCLLNTQRQLTLSDYQQFWGKMKEASQNTITIPQSSLYGGYSQSGSDDQALTNLATGLNANFITFVGSANGKSFFGAMTENNLPFLFEVQPCGFSGDKSGVLSVTYRVPVPPVKQLYNEAINFLLTLPA